MTRRSIAALFVLTIVTFGIYGIVWFVPTKEEMNAQGADIPTAWLLIVPVVGLYWMWRYSAGVEKVTEGKTSQVISFILLAVLGLIGMAIIQDGLNKVADQRQIAAPVPVG